MRDDAWFVTAGQPRFHPGARLRRRPRGNRAASGIRCPAVAGSALLGLPEDLVDLLDLGEQLVGLRHVDAALGAGRASQLGGLVEQRVQLRVLREVRGLEVVGPQYPQVVLDQLGPLFLDDQRAGLERWVFTVLVLLADGLDGLGLDACLRRVVDPAGEVAVRVGGGLRFQETGEQPHRSPSLSDHEIPVSDTTRPGLASTWRGCMRWPLWSIKVAEPSMEPALHPGDWLLLCRTIDPGRPLRVRAGQIVVARHPGRPGMLIVKRAARREPGGWWLASDNPQAGAVDSRAFGVVPPSLIEGRLLLRYRRARQPGR